MHLVRPHVHCQQAPISGGGGGDSAAPLKPDLGRGEERKEGRPWKKGSVGVDPSQTRWIGKPDQRKLVAVLTGDSAFHKPFRREKGKAILINAHDRGDIKQVLSPTGRAFNFPLDIPSHFTLSKFLSINEKGRWSFTY